MIDVKKERMLSSRTCYTALTVEQTATVSFGVLMIFRPSGPSCLTISHDGGIVSTTDRFSMTDGTFFHHGRVMTNSSNISCSSSTRHDALTKNNNRGLHIVCV